jgi:hypothetical protein
LAARGLERVVRNQACIHEDEVVATLKLSQWPDGCEPELRHHVGGCASCAQLVELAQALLEDHQALLVQAEVPSSAIGWWRAQMRSRREAAQVVTQPITFVQGLILACAAGLMVAAVGFFVPTFRRAIEWGVGAAGSLPSISLSLPPNALASPIVMAAGAALLLCAIVLPVALYFTFQEEK